MEKNIKKVILLIIFIAILVFLIAIFLKEKESEKNKTASLVYNYDLSSCLNLPRGHHEIPTDILRKRIKYMNSSIAQGSDKVVFELPEFSDSDIDNILNLAKPYFKAIEGYSYSDIEYLSFVPVKTVMKPHSSSWDETKKDYIRINAYGVSIENEGYLRLSLRAHTGEKTSCPHKLVDENNDWFDLGLNDYCEMNFDSSSVLLKYNKRADGLYDFSVEEYYQTFSTDIPDKLAQCSLGLLKKSQSFIDFYNEKDDINNIYFGLTGWDREYDLQDNKFDYINAVAFRGFDVIKFLINPWTGEVKEISRESTPFLNN